jgi:hypothetical protein
MPGKNRGRAVSNKDMKKFLEIQKPKKKKTPAKGKARMNRGGDPMKMNRGGGAKKKRGMARGCGAATKGKGYNK